MIKMKKLEELYLSSNNNWKYPSQSFIKDSFLDIKKQLIDFQKIKEVGKFNILFRGQYLNEPIITQNKLVIVGEERIGIYFFQIE